MNLHRLVKLAARAFYDDLTSKGDNQPKTGRSDNRGIAVVVLDALTRFEFSFWLVISIWAYALRSFAESSTAESKDGKEIWYQWSWGKGKARTTQELNCIYIGEKLSNEEMLFQWQCLLIWLDRQTLKLSYWMSRNYVFHYLSGIMQKLILIELEFILLQHR